MVDNQPCQLGHKPLDICISEKKLDKSLTKSWIKIHLTFEFYYLGFRLFPKNLMYNTLISLQNWVIKDAGRLSFLFVERNCADIKRDIWVGCCTFLVLCELKNWGKYDCPLSWCTMGPIWNYIIIFIDVQFHEKILIFPVIRKQGDFC